MYRKLFMLLAGGLCAASAAGEDRMIREIELQGYRVRIHLREQVLRLDAPEERDWAEDDEQGPVEAPLYPTLPAARGGCVSAATLAEKAKQFDDGLYAAVEFAAQQGIGKFGGKAYMLKALADELSKHTSVGSSQGALTTFFAATRLGDIPAPPPTALEPHVAALVESFRNDALRSKPIGFYTWSRNLEAIFQQDRMLQRELTEAGEIEAVLSAFEANPHTAATYGDYLELVERLTNPFVAEMPDLRGLLRNRSPRKSESPRGGVFFFPPSRAHETDLIKKLYGNTPIPDGFDLATEMIQRIRDGRLDLQPTKQSGWYDHQTWALVPLVTPLKTPEGARLEFSAAYERLLESLFKAILARTRETHIKQLEIPAVGAAAPVREPVIIRVRPELAVEPLATYYLRRAESYAFIRGVLKKTFGEDALKAMKLWTPDGQSDRNVADELDAIEQLFKGAYYAACHELGLMPQTNGSLTQADALRTTAFGTWAANAAADRDLGRDGRMMVPVFFDIPRGKTKVWAFLGWTTRAIEVSYAKIPRFELSDAAGKPVALSDELQVIFDEDRYELPYPVIAEVYVTQILNRAEFAAHCDKYKTPKAIVENLK